MYGSKRYECAEKKRTVTFPFCAKLNPSKQCTHYEGCGYKKMQQLLHKAKDRTLQRQAS